MRYKLCKFVSVLRVGDIVPAKPLLTKYNWYAEEPEQPTPVQATLPAPQGYEVAVLPMQFQPAKAVGDIVGDNVGL